MIKIPAKKKKKNDWFRKGGSIKTGQSVAHILQMNWHEVGRKSKEMRTESLRSMFLILVLIFIGQKMTTKRKEKGRIQHWKKEREVACLKKVSIIDIVYMITSACTFCVCHPIVWLLCQPRLWTLHPSMR